MKKIITILLTISCIFSLAACGQKKEVKISEPENIILEKTNENNEEKEILTEEVKTTEPTEKENNKKESSEITKDEEKPTNNSNESEKKEKGKIALAEHSTLELNPEFNGLYQIGSSAKGTIMNNSFFTAELTSIANKNKGQVDFSNANLVDNITDYKDFIYVLLELDNNEIVNWDIIDRKTGESVFNFNEDKLLNYYYPETNFELIEAGQLPETINLSDYEVNKTYVFDVEDNFSFPKIINDTNYSILTISTKDIFSGNSFKRKYISKHAMPDNSVSNYDSEDGKFNISIIEEKPENLLASENCLTLDGYNIDDELDFDFEDIVGNNTDKTFILTVKDWNEEFEFTLKPGEFLTCSWMDDVFVKDIK